MKNTDVSRSRKGYLQVISTEKEKKSVTWKLGDESWIDSQGTIGLQRTAFFTKKL
jgi:hypothetical protein